MSELRCPQDIVAIFHASFHPTQGNVIDWSIKASDDVSLDNLEFSALPSGLHLVEQDVIYFTKDEHHGVCVFRRRKTTEQGHRGFRLSSLGILLAKSARSKPWRHLSALKDLVATIYTRLEVSEILEPNDEDWEPARFFFEERKVRQDDLGGAGQWNGWSFEFDGDENEGPVGNPTLHLPHLLRILGPSSLTLYKHVIGRKRILIFTLPPVQAACILCHVAADMCYEYQEASPNSTAGRLQGKCKEGINVLGLVTLSDLDRMQKEGTSGRGWIACTTDAIFLEKPSHYDLLIDLTASTPNKATRPAFFSSRPVLPSGMSSRGPTHRLSSVRFAWSDIKLWNELDRILQLDSSQCADTSCCSPSSSSSSSPDPKSKLITAWTDVWRVYEDVCIICAGLWIGSWRGNSPSSYSTANGSANWGSVRLEGDDDLTLTAINGSDHVRSLGLGIEGRPSGSSSNKPMRRSSGMSWSSERASPSGSTADGQQQPGDRDEAVRTDGQLLTTLALLQTFHAHTSFQVSTLETFLPPLPDRPKSIVQLTPRDVLLFELGPLSGVDAKYLEWLGQEYGGGAQIVVRRGWKDVFGIIFGYG
ncbi:hypothetical protein ARMGADRAFT_1047655 [Armillaria gallica]|uniref:Protein LCHN n=1 Tax=Armillaria gallica TaxID=47427 RepID=A0A2H3CW21_ARMGA|nr:hypothetical protein ARMGADRAFT_1047655 [Armillaria gallica]